MRPKSLMLLALALGCGLVASIGISQVLESRRRQSNASVETTDILVATEDIARNAEFSPKNVALKPWPKHQLPLGTITKLEDVVGRRPNTPIVKDEPVLEGKLGTGEGAAPASKEIPPGFRAVAVRVDNAQNSGLILPGDRVDVQVFVNKGPNVPEATTSTFLEDVSVFAVNSEIRHESSSDSKSIDAKNISLLVTPEQAAKLTLAAEVGTIRLVLRGPHKEETKDAIKVTLPGILGGPSENGTNQGKPGTGTGNDMKAFLDKQPAADKPADPPPADDNVFRMVIMHGQDAHVEELHSGELLPRKLDAAGNEAAGGGDTTPTKPTSPHSIPSTTHPTSPPAAGNDGTLHRSAS